MNQTARGGFYKVSTAAQLLVLRWPKLQELQSFFNCPQLEVELIEKSEGKAPCSTLSHWLLWSLSGPPWSCTLAATRLSSTERSPPVLPMPTTRTLFPRKACTSLYSRLWRCWPLKRLSMPRQRAACISCCQIHFLAPALCPDPLQPPTLPLPPLLAAEKPMEVLASWVMPPSCTSSAQSCFANPNGKAWMHLYKVFFPFSEMSPPISMGSGSCLLQWGGFMEQAGL